MCRIQIMDGTVARMFTIFITLASKPLRESCAHMRVIPARKRRRGD
jgi:hypothetical protein